MAQVLGAHGAAQVDARLAAMKAEFDVTVDCSEASRTQTRTLLALLETIGATDNVAVIKSKTPEWLKALSHLSLKMRQEDFADAVDAVAALASKHKRKWKMQDYCSVVQFLTESDWQLWSDECTHPETANLLFVRKATELGCHKPDERTTQLLATINLVKKHGQNGALKLPGECLTNEHRICKGAWKKFLAGCPEQKLHDGERPCRELAALPACPDIFRVEFPKAFEHVYRYGQLPRECALDLLMIQTLNSRYSLRGNAPSSRPLYSPIQLGGSIAGSPGRSLFAPERLAVEDGLSSLTVFHQNLQSVTMQNERMAKRLDMLWNARGEEGKLQLCDGEPSLTNGTNTVENLSGPERQGLLPKRSHSFSSAGGQSIDLNSAVADCGQASQSSDGPGKGASMQSITQVDKMLDLDALAALLDRRSTGKRGAIDVTAESEAAIDVSRVPVDDHPAPARKRPASALAHMKRPAGSHATMKKPAAGPATHNRGIREEQTRDQFVAWIVVGGAKRYKTFKFNGQKRKAKSMADAWVVAGGK